MKAFITYNDLIQNYVIILLLHALRKYFAKATLYKIISLLRPPPYENSYSKTY